MKKLLLFFISTVLLVTLLSCSNSNKDVFKKDMDKLSDGITMKQVSDFLAEKNLEDGIEFSSDKDSDDYELSEYSNYKFDFRVKNGVLNFSLIDGNRKDLIIFGDNFFSVYNNKERSYINYLYDKEEMKTALSNVHKDIDNLPFTLSDFVKVEDTEDGFEISAIDDINVDEVSPINQDENDGVLTIDNMLLFVKYDTLYIRLSIKNGVDATPVYYQFKGVKKDYITRYIPESTVECQDITPDLVKFNSLQNVILAAENVGDYKDRHLRGHISEPLISSENCNLEIPFDLNYYTTKDSSTQTNVHYSINIPLSYSYSHFDSSIFNGVSTKNKSILQILYDKVDSIDFSELGSNLDALKLGINFKFIESSEFLQAIKDKQDINFLIVGENDSQSFIVYTVDKNGKKSILSSDENLDIFNQSWFVKYNMSYIKYVVNRMMDNGEVDVHNDYTQINNNTSTKFSSEIINLWKDSFVQVFSSTNYHTGYSVSKESITFNTKNNILNGIVLESYFRDFKDGNTGLALKINIENLGLCDKDQIVADKQLFNDLVK